MHRLLVISNETIEGDALHDAIRDRTAGRRAEVLVVAPALNSRLRHWMSLRVFGADELVIATHPAARSNWLARGLVDRARERFELPVTHVVVDLARHEEYVAA